MFASQYLVSWLSSHSFWGGFRLLFYSMSPFSILTVNIFREPPLPSLTLCTVLILFLTSVLTFSIPFHFYFYNLLFIFLFSLTLFEKLNIQQSLKINMNDFLTGFFTIVCKIFAELEIINSIEDMRLQLETDKTAT